MQVEKCACSVSAVKSSSGLLLVQLSLLAELCIELLYYTLNIDNFVPGGVWQSPWQHRDVGRDR